MSGELSQEGWATSPQSSGDWTPSNGSAEDPGSGGWILVAAASAILLSLLLLGFGEALLPNILGWVLGSVITFSLVALYGRRTRLRTFITGRTGDRRLHQLSIGLLVLGFVTVAIHAYLIAQHYS